MHSLRPKLLTSNWGTNQRQVIQDGGNNRKKKLLASRTYGEAKSVSCTATVTKDLAISHDGRTEDIRSIRGRPFFVDNSKSKSRNQKTFTSMLLGRTRTNTFAQASISPFPRHHIYISSTCPRGQSWVPMVPVRVT